MAARKRTTNRNTEGRFKTFSKKTLGSASYVAGVFVEGIAAVNLLLPDESIGYSSKLSLKDQIKSSYQKGKSDLNSLVQGWLED